MIIQRSPDLVSGKICHSSLSYLMQGGTHDGYKEAVVEVVQKLGADQGMRDLHHSIAELKRVHEQHE